MKNILCILLSLLAAGLAGGIVRAAEPGQPTAAVRHDLEVSLHPGSGRFAAKDTVTLPAGAGTELFFSLHRGLSPALISDKGKITRTGGPARAALTETFRISLPRDASSFVIGYGGRIHHPLEGDGQDNTRLSRRTPGLISGEGVHLSGASLWYPDMGRAVSFSLTVELPPGWEAISQGRRTLHDADATRTRVRWDCPQPQQQIYLIASRFTTYERQNGRVVCRAFLRRPDDALAERYLAATDRYIHMYQGLIGPYPYEKFALVENFWETGLGMPSFTLMGPSVIRLPFILTTSYPHEILHNWWGNSVYPDYEKGNWAEGLTSYLADHLFKEQKGKGRAYRLGTLQKYADYVKGRRDFPLSAFRSRHSASSQAVGYGKALMFFHMLRRKMGDTDFTEGLRAFYLENRFANAGYGKLKESFERVSGRDLTDDFAQWVHRTGAPRIGLRNLAVKEEAEGFFLGGEFLQEQAGAPYKLAVPLTVTLAGTPNAFQATVPMDGKTARFRLRFATRPLRVDVDPEFDLFRRLDLRETPPALSQALGAEKLLILLPSAAGKDDRKNLVAWRAFAQALSAAAAGKVEIGLDTETARLPRDRAVVVLGRTNHHVSGAMKALSPYGAKLIVGGIVIDGKEISTKEHAIVLAGRNPARPESAVVLVTSDLSAALPGLGRKLPHYHRYSYLGFRGKEPINTLKGRFQVQDSPMTRLLPDSPGNVAAVSMGKVPERKALAELPPPLSR